MGKVKYAVLLLLALAGAGEFLYAMNVDGMAIAEVTGKDSKRIMPQQYLSKEIALVRPVIIKGRITDKGKEPIPAIKVYITNLLNFESIESTTDNDGIFQIELPANETPTTYKLSVKFLSGEFEFESDKIFAEKPYQVSKNEPSGPLRASSTMCLNELIYNTDRYAPPKDEKATLILNIALQKNSILTKEPKEAAAEIISNKLNPSIPTSIIERLIARFEELRKINSEELIYFEVLGLLQYRLKEMQGRNYKDAAINRLRMAVKLGSTNMEVFRKLIDLLCEKGFYGESIQVAVKARNMIGEDAKYFDDKQEFEWVIRRSKFNIAEQNKEKKITDEEKNMRNEWSLKLIEDQRTIYRTDGYPDEIKNYERREGVQQEWWYYEKGLCYIFLNGILNTKLEY